MATSSILGGQSAPRKAAGRDADALGPSDSSDSGSDVQGERPMPTLPDSPGELGAVPADTDSDTDAAGTGERASATGEHVREAADILPDRVGAAGDTAPARDVEDLVADEEIDSGDEEAGEADLGASVPTDTQRREAGPMAGKVRRVRAAPNKQR